MTNLPALVMIIRHGEKPGNPADDTDGGSNLSTLGSARAAALPSLFTADPNATPVNNLQQLDCNVQVESETLFTGNYFFSGINAGLPRFPTPQFLFATHQESNNGSNRPVETISPLAQALQLYSNNPSLQINSNFTNTNDQPGLLGLVDEITVKNPNTYAGKVILICWHHGMIPQLVLDFGVPANQLPWPKWPSTVFDLVFMITWTNGQPNLAVKYQQLLYGDTTTPSDT